MTRKVTLVVWGARMLLEIAELAVRAKRSLDSSLGDGRWRRPPWQGRNDFWGDGR